MTFEELGLDAPLRHAIADLGYVEPTPIQAEVIPWLLSTPDRDCIALAQTGTGKTAAYGLPLLQHTDATSRALQAIILCPTRELCLQIADDLKDYATYLEHLHVLPVYGGASIEGQLRLLRRGAQIIVATPGRLIDLMERGAVKAERAATLILDEADEMLNMGFSESIDRILQELPEEHTTLLFSATMGAEIERIAKTYLREYKEIVVGSRNEGAENVNHQYYLVQARDKYLALKRVVDYYPRIYAIIFCRTRLETQQVADLLIRDGYNAEALHGDLSQQQRDLCMQKFRQHQTQLLVATDVAARGLDVNDLTHVINFSLPDDVESYTHRSGRTGRAGKRGTSISIIHLRERGRIRLIERTLGQKFEAATLPEPREICAKQLYRVVDRLEHTDVDEQQIAPFMPEVLRRLEWLSKEELLGRFLTQAFGRFLRYYENAPQIVQPTERAPQSRRSQSAEGGASRAGRSQAAPRGTSAHPGGATGHAPREVEQGYKRLFINLGKRDNFYARELINLINRYVKGRVQLGRIDLTQNCSFVEVPEADAPLVLQKMRGAKVGQRRVVVDDAERTGEKGRRERRAETSRHSADAGRAPGTGTSTARARRQAELDNTVFPDRTPGAGRTDSQPHTSEEDKQTDWRQFFQK